jgi:hypothetical protein
MKAACAAITAIATKFIPLDVVAAELAAQKCAVSAEAIRVYVTAQ